MATKSRGKENKLSPYLLEPYKTDFRRDVIAKRREVTRQAHQLTKEKSLDLISKIPNANKDKTLVNQNSNNNNRDNKSKPLGRLSNSSVHHSKEKSESKQSNEISSLSQDFSRPIITNSNQFSRDVRERSIDANRQYNRDRSLDFSKQTAQLNREKSERRLNVNKNQHRSVVTIDTHKARNNIDVLRMVIRDLGWREFPFMRRDHNCDVTWHAVNFHEQDIYTGQVNKFPGSHIFQKVNLFRWLEMMKSLFPEQYKFFPRTWLLPQQLHEFSNEARALIDKKPRVRPTYIAKPSDGSQGEGIYLLRDPSQYSSLNGRSYVVQEYMSNVLLIDKFKFDLRVYVVLKSLDPLEFYICKEGLARFSTIPYEQPTHKNIHEAFMHLTNYSLNKKSSDFRISQKDDEGSKRKMTAVFRQMEKMGHDVELMWTKIEHMVTKTLIAVAGELKVEYLAAISPGKPGPTCFQILGFDVLILKDLEPVLLEVNAHPSLGITEEHETPNGGVEYCISAKDEDVKRKLIRDTLILIAPKHKYTRKRKKYKRHRRNTEDISDENTKFNPRERAISIKYMDMDEEKPDRSRSLFDETENRQKKFVRTETCRVFIEGEGEVIFTADGPSSVKSLNDSKKKNDLNSKTDSNNNSEGDVEKMDTSDHLPSLFDKSIEKDDRVEDEKNMNSENVESSDEEEESSLKQIFPSLYSKEFEKERIIERLADIFIYCLGVKGCLRLGPTMFRLFARKCRLNRKGITNAAIDILYIDMQRKWEYLNPDRTSGLKFFSFVASCVKIASTTFYGKDPLDQLVNFQGYCDRSLKLISILEQEAALNREQRYSVKTKVGQSRHSKQNLIWETGSSYKQASDLDEEEERIGYVSTKGKMTADWPFLLEEGFVDRTFIAPHRQHKNVFHALQSIKK